jgi:benzoylformate decarboxylase
MAQGYELAHGSPAAVIIPGVGIPHASSNLYNAWKDRSSIIVLTDGGHSEYLGRDMFEQVDDWLEPARQFTKWSWHVKHPQRTGEMVRRALKVAATPPGGPVYIRFPIDVLGKKSVRDKIYPQSRFSIPLNIEPDPELIDKAAKLLIESKKPLINAGGEITRAGANDDLIELAELLSIPVSQGVSCYGDIPFKHPLFAGFYTMGPNFYSVSVDMFMNLGALMPDPGFISNPVPPTCKVIHARIEYEDIANIYPTDVAIAANMKKTIQALNSAIKGMLSKERINTLKKERLEKVKADLAAMSARRTQKAEERWNASPLSWERLSYEMDQILEDDACIVSELDAYDAYYWMDFSKGKKTLIGQTTGFALGWGVGAALGAKIALPDTQVVCLVGDGTMLFGQLESLWTYSRYDVPVIIVVYNNRSYDGPRNRMFNLANRPQEDMKDIACYLGNPDVDFVGIANSFNIKGEQIASPEQIKPAMKRAVQATKDGRPYLIDAIIAQRGAGAGLNWHPEISIAELRTKKL